MEKPFNADYFKSLWTRYKAQSSLISPDQTLSTSCFILSVFDAADREAQVSFIMEVIHMILVLDQPDVVGQ